MRGATSAQPAAAAAAPALAPRASLDPPSPRRAQVKYIKNNFGAFQRVEGAKTELVGEDWLGTAPEVTWEPSGKDAKYMLVMIDPDYPRRVGGAEAGEIGPWIQWFGLNLVDSAKGGYQAVPYEAPAPPPGTGQHRYIFLLFQQTGPAPDGVDLNLFFAGGSRAKWPIGDFVEQLKGAIVPVAMNFFYAKSKEMPAYGDDANSFHAHRDLKSEL